MPAAVGLNVTVTLQVLPAATPAVQVVVWLNAAALVPVRVNADTVRVPVPVLVTVMLCVALLAPTVVDAKVKLVGDADAVTVVGATPVPVSAAVLVVAPVAATESVAL